MPSETATPIQFRDCPKHPQSKWWHSATGIRCSICGDMLNGEPPPPPEPVRVQSLDYAQSLTKRTSVAWKNGMNLTEKQAHLLQAALGMSAEAGEFLNRVKKHIMQGHPLDDAMEAKLREEIGDIHWYACDAASALDVAMSDVVTANESKLQRRYPTGFSPERSIRREDTTANASLMGVPVHLPDPPASEGTR